MIDFLKYRFFYFSLSGIVLMTGIFSLMKWGLRLSIDFTGGSIIQIQNSKIRNQNNREKIKNIFKEKEINIISLQESGNKSLILKTKPIDRNKWEEVKKILEKDYGKIEEQQFETVGPVLGKELLVKTAYASLVAILGILFYVAWAFKDLKYGVSAVLALLHDLLVITGFFSLFGHFYGVEIDTLFVTAALTTMSFSVHDTIVVFDRIRETVRNESLPLEMVVNKSLTETISRSLNNSLTIVFMLLALTLIGGETIKWFAVALLIGTISGSYSSPCVATPILYFLSKRGGEKK